MSNKVPICAIPSLENGGYPVGGAEVLLVVPLVHERTRGTTTPRSASSAFDQLFANTAIKKCSNIVEWFLSTILKYLLTSSSFTRSLPRPRVPNCFRIQSAPQTYPARPKSSSSQPSKRGSQASALQVHFRKENLTKLSSIQGKYFT